jgi:hypothetical protein
MLFPRTLESIPPSLRDFEESVAISISITDANILVWPDLYDYLLEMLFIYFIYASNKN